MIFKKKKPSNMLYAGISSTNISKDGATARSGERKGSLKRKLVIGVTSLKRGVGSSYTSIAIANFLRQYNKEKACVLHMGCGYIDDALDDGADSVYYPCNMADIYSKYECIVYDGGFYSETDANMLDRCDIKIMMCWRNTEYERLLYEFIKTRNNVDNWVFLFKEVPSKKKDYVYALMEDYNVECLPTFDVLHLDKVVIDIFKSIFYE